MSKQMKMKTVMQMAWSFVKQNGMKIGEALKCAWRNFKLKAKMMADSAYFSYIKKTTGEIRVAHGTLAGSAITYVPNGRGRPTPETMQRYWDMDANGWRMFDRANLLTVAA